MRQGYNVRATVRSVSNKEKVAHLESLAAALPGTLELYEADLLNDGSFDKVISGADFVFHTASPFLREVGDPEVTLGLLHIFYLGLSDKLQVVPLIFAS